MTIEPFRHMQRTEEGATMEGLSEPFRPVKGAIKQM
jgi:hypothetical protein